MITHIVLFKLKPDTDEATIAHHMSDFRALAQTVRAIRAIEVERDFVGRDVSAEFGLVVQLEDRDALDAYRNHPDHQAAFTRLTSNLDHMLVLDYER
jgi:quinol monooxygenase YgiN